MDDPAILRAYLISLGIGLLIGVERERADAGSAGLRSFALIALSGTTAAWLARESGTPWLLPVALLGVVALWLAADLRDPEHARDPGTTTGIAFVLCFLLGAMLVYHATYIAVAIAVVVTLLLYFKTELHGITHRLTREELLSFLQFAVLAFVALPLLPDRGFGPFAAVNPARVGQFAVLICAMNLCGYAALRLFDDHRAVAITGLLGGLVSSTATTLALSRQTRGAGVPPELAALGILLANQTVLLRLAVLAGIAAPAILPSLLPVIAGGLAGGLIAPLWLWRRLPAEQPEVAMSVTNPAELKAALGFAALFALVLVVTAAAHHSFGTGGLYAVAAISGLTDVDAITLSTLRLFGGGQVAAATALGVVLTAFGANLIFKLGLVAGIGGRTAARHVALGYLLSMAGLLVGGLLPVRPA
ncbi:MgtC/SapB family protein [Solimonas variicoloris]|uniref:MgtC/SapB family protein n=1 Tax=Solimonas variicoloris TaxID=254408 RepID=UPI0003673993|nr:MgtC/SapB family protein [Solimonas variicoloris]